MDGGTSRGDAGLAPSNIRGMGMGQVLAMTEHGFSNLQGSGDRPGQLVWARAPENVGRGWGWGAVYLGTRKPPRAVSSNAS